MRHVLAANLRHFGEASLQVFYLALGESSGDASCLTLRIHRNARAGSTLHLFNKYPDPKPSQLWLPEDNKGRLVLERLGWTEDGSGKGLGPKGLGRSVGFGGTQRWLRSSCKHTNLALCDALASAGSSLSQRR